MSKGVLGDARTVVELGRRLAGCSDVTRFNDGQREESEALAYALADIEEALRSILEKHLPKLVDPEADCSILNASLLDIGEDLRHVLYHVKDSKFYGYLNPGP
jgi:hypothetical protein